MKHNPRRCSLCGSLPHGFARLCIRRTLIGQTRRNGENAGEAK